MAVQTLEDILREQNPGAVTTWNGWESRLKKKSFTPKGHRGMYGDFVGFIKKADPNAYAKGVSALEALNAPKETPAALPTVSADPGGAADDPKIEAQVNKVTEEYVGDGTVANPKRKRSSTILTGLHGDGAAAPMVKRKTLLGSFSG